MCGSPGSRNTGRFKRYCSEGACGFVDTRKAASSLFLVRFQRLHDFQATLLHLPGIDHKRLTYRFQGRDFRLTDVHGEVVKGLIA